MIGIVAWDFEVQVQKLIRESGPKNTLGSIHISTLVDLKSRLTYAIPRAPLNVDVRVGVSDEPSLRLDTDLREHEAVASALQRRAGQVNSGENRMDAYMRILGDLVPLATRIEILDPYAATSVMSPSKEGDSVFGRAWLLGQIMQANPDVSISIWSELQKPQGREFEPERSRLRGLIDKFEAIRVSTPGFRGHLTVNVRQDRNRPSVFHARTIHMHLANGSIGFGLDKGLDTFSQSVFSHQSILDYRSPVQHTTYLGQISSQTREVCPPIRVR